MSKEKPRLNQIIFVDLNYSDGWDILKRGKPYVIIKLKKEDEKFYYFHSLIITSQDESEIKEEQERQSILQYEIRQLPKCLKIDPSFLRIHRYVDLKIAKSKLIKSLCNKCSRGCFTKKEYDFFVKKHHNYRDNKLNASKLRPPIEVEIV